MTAARGRVCLTADVHNRSPRSRDQRSLPGSELDALARYLEITSAHELPVTAFISGKAAIEEPQRLKELYTQYPIEIGGHWYDPFGSLLGQKVLGKLTGLRRGLAMQQAREIRRTRTAIECATGVRIRAWRDHAYRHDRNTNRLLLAAGIGIISDEVSAAKLGPERAGGILSVPINTLPDHDSIAHGGSLSGLPRGATLSSDDWLRAVCRQVDAIVGAGGVATLLVHPACMAIVDDFACFRRLCGTLAHYEAVRLSDLAELRASWACAV